MTGQLFMLPAGGSLIQNLVAFLMHFDRERDMEIAFDQKHTRQPFQDVPAHTVDMSHIACYLPSARACLHLTKAFARLPYTVMLPRLYALNDLETLAVDHGCWSALTPVDLHQKRHLFMRIMHQHRPDLSITQLLSFSQSMMSAVNELYQEDVSVEHVRALLLEEDDIRGQNDASLTSLLPIVLDHYPRILDAWNQWDPAFYKKHVYESLVKAWENAPHTPIIIAGINQYQKDSLTLMQRALDLSHGCVLIPRINSGASCDLPFFKNSVQAPHKHFDASPNADTQKILANLPVAPKNLEGFVQDQSFFSYESLSQSAYARDIARIILDYQARGCTSLSLVVPERSFVREVKALLKNHITLNDSHAIGLRDTPLGSFIFTACTFLCTPTLKYYIALLKQPLFCLHTLYQGAHDAPFVQDQDVLYDSCHASSMDGPVRVSKHFSDFEKALHMFEGTVRSKQPVPQTMSDIALEEIPYGTPFKNFLEQAKENEYFSAHHFYLRKLHWFVNGIYGALNEAGQQCLTRFFNVLKNISEIYPAVHALRDQEWRMFVLQALEDITVPSPVPHQEGMHVNVIGMMEARVDQSDVMVITHLEEGTLPRRPGYDPWLSQPLRKMIDLRHEASLQGLQAQDFFSSMTHARHIVLTRCANREGKDTVPSRFLKHMKRHFHVTPYVIEHQDMHQNQRFPSLPSVRKDYMCPPCPPVKSRPLKLSVSSIKMLMEDPYGFYAKYILKLRPLFPWDHDVFALVFGNAMHKALEIFSSAGYAFCEMHASHLLDLFIKHVSGAVPLSPLMRQRLEYTAKWLCGDGAFSQKDSPFRTFCEHPLTHTFSIEREEGATPVTLYARCDRIDVYASTYTENTASHKNDMGQIAGSALSFPHHLPIYANNNSPLNIRIVDYKTGTPPTYRAMREGYAPQMPLEGLLLRMHLSRSVTGAADHLPGHRDANTDDLSHTENSHDIELVHTQLMGKAPFGANSMLQNSGSYMDAAEQGLPHLLSDYLCKDFFFYSCPDPEHMPAFSEYVHLGRAYR